jgi:two-component system, OmpR family, alkaline phosphatase synthesis response regulator PhoP
MPKKILVVDDEKDIVEMLKYNLQKEGYKVISAHNGKEALERAQQRPDLILLDIMMPVMDGLQTLKALKQKKETESIPVIFLTAKGAETDEIVGLEIGAEDYIVKPISVGKILARVRAVFRRIEHPHPADLGPEVLTIDEVHINVPNYSVSVSNKEVPFPKKEFETLVYLVRNRGRVITRQSLLDAIWGENVYVVDRTVDVHIRKIREKLGKYGDHIETVKGVGYRFRE